MFCLNFTIICNIKSEPEVKSDSKLTLSKQNNTFLPYSLDKNPQHYVLCISSAEKKEELLTAREIKEEKEK